MDWPLDYRPEMVTHGFFSHPPDDYRVVYNTPTHALHLYSYHARHRLNDALYELTPGDLTITPAGVDSSYSLQSEGRHWCIHFNPAVEAEGEWITLPSYLPQVGPEILESFKRIVALANHGGHGEEGATRLLRRSRIELLLQELLLSLAGHAADEGVGGNRSRREAVFQELIHHIEANLVRPLTVPDLARSVRMSQNYLSRQFRHRFGMTITDYILKRRIELARYYLESTSLTVSEIGSRVGIPNPQYFNKQFRRLTTLSPRAIALN